MRSYSLNLAGRVGNFNLPKNRPLIPLYEAVVNSIQAIDERKKNETDFLNGKIYIDVLRSQQQSTEDDDEFYPITGFVVTDNGIGFNNNNMESFLESDSLYKADIGGKGVGRFTWLKAFNRIVITSNYKHSDKFYKRNFEFSLKNKYVDDTAKISDNQTDSFTKVELITYLPQYKNEVPKNLENIAIRLIQHCLIYFINDNNPNMILRDNRREINLNDYFENNFKTETNINKFSIKNQSFSLLNVRIIERDFPGNKLYLCGNNRLVYTKDLGKQIVDLSDSFFDKYKFWYIGILTSEFLDKNIENNRLAFSIPEKQTGYDQLSIEDITRESCKFIEEYLSDYLKPIKENKMSKINDYIIKEAPQYRHLLKHKLNRIEEIKPELDNIKLDDALYDIKREFDKESKKEQEKLLNQFDKYNMNVELFESQFMNQIGRISDANSAVLVEYVSHRKIIIELLERGLRRNDDGKFNKEKYVHSLIYPMRKTADDIDYDSHNLWLLDEKLSYCTYISSDIPFDNNVHKDRTDLLVLDNPVAVSDDKNDGSYFDTIVIFELKRPMRDDYSDSNNPINQLYEYVREIRSGKARDRNHRPIKVNNSTKFYLYLVCDITDSLSRFIDINDFIKSPDNLGLYKYNGTYNAYFEILSYDKILNDAKKRNRVFFDKLGI